MEFIEVIFVNLGLMFFVASLMNYSRIMKIITNKRMLLYWRITFILTLFFMMGYVYKIYQLITLPDTSDLMVSLVYMFGALFVFVITGLSIQSLKVLADVHKTLRGKD